MAKEDYDALASAIEAVNRDDAKEPDIPVAVALQEAEDLNAWCLADKEALVKAGLDWTLVDSLPKRTGACRYVQSLWQNDYRTQEEAQKEWKLQAPDAYKLHDDLIHDFLHAFFAIPDLLSKTQKIAEGSGNADMIQDLSDLSQLGKNNPEPLKKINFDVTLLDKAAALSTSLPVLLAQANGQKLGDNKMKILRDKSYAYMKQAVSEIRRNGQYAFWRNEDRRKGYVSRYYKQRPSATKTQPQPPQQTK
ncbi:MAG TPA: hypothetical protein VIH57_19035 [Bacteroidales bacterium]